MSSSTRNIRSRRRGASSIESVSSRSVILLVVVLLCSRKCSCFFFFHFDNSPFIFLPNTYFPASIVMRPTEDSGLARVFTPSTCLMPSLCASNLDERGMGGEGGGRGVRRRQIKDVDKIMQELKGYVLWKSDTESNTTTVNGGCLSHGALCLTLATTRIRVGVEKYGWDAFSSFPLPYLVGA